MLFMCHGLLTVITETKMHKQMKLGIRSSVLACLTALILGISNQTLAGDDHASEAAAHDKDMNFRIVTDVTPSIRDDGESTADHSKFEGLQQDFATGP